MMFSSHSNKALFKAALFKNTPAYVQFYITARCNLTCDQCNIIYSNSDVRESSIDEINLIADNFVKIGVAIVLLTGGEPFARKDLHLIIKAFESRGIHVRLQTNGFASEEQIYKAVEAGASDISISLDSLHSNKQDLINGGFNKSWHQAIKAISLFTKYLPRKNSFASLGCVIQPSNLDDISDVIEFGTAISWFTSLVPVHVTNYSSPAGFRTFDNNLKFKSEDYNKVDSLIESVRGMRNKKYLLYDSDQYLNDIKKFIRGESTTWRSKNNNVCDSPNLYFALLPNGEMSPCCDYRMDKSYPAYAKEFPEIFSSKSFRNEVYQIVRDCSGCMYGSYPEISISMRFLEAKIQRAKTFIFDPPEKNWPLSYDEIIEISNNIVSKKQKPYKRIINISS